MQRVKLKIQILENANGEPEYGSDEASGLDLKAGIDNNIILKQKEFITIPTGLIIEIPKGYEAQVRPRSGLASKYGVTVLNTPGTVDSDYRGEVKVILINHNVKDFSISPGMKIAQLVLSPVLRPDINFIGKIVSKTKRGNRGFGSTGL